MRRLAVATLLALAVSPATAASRSSDEREAARVAARLNSPAAQDAVSGIMVAFADLLMDVRVDKLRAAIARVDPDFRGDSDADDVRTLGDLVRRDDPYFRERLADDSRVAVGTVGAMASGMADMLPELRAMGDRMGRDIEKAIRRLPRD